MLSQTCTHVSITEVLRHKNRINHSAQMCTRNTDNRQNVSGQRRDTATCFSSHAMPHTHTNKRAHFPLQWMHSCLALRNEPQSCGVLFKMTFQNSSSRLWRISRCFHHMLSCSQTCHWGCSTHIWGYGWSVLQVTHTHIKRPRVHTLAQTSERWKLH